MAGAIPWPSLHRKAWVPAEQHWQGHAEAPIFFWSAKQTGIDSFSQAAIPN